MTPDFTMTGQILSIGETEFKGEKNFKVREFVVERVIEQRRGDDIREPIQFKLQGDRCDVLDYLSEGDSVEVCADVTGREWQGKHFVNLVAWKVTKEGDAKRPASRTAPQSQNSSDADRLKKPGTGIPPGNEDEPVPF